MSDLLTADDIEELRKIHALVGDDGALARAITIYYRDGDRAARTPRETMYLHMGILAGTIARLVEGRDTSSDAAMRAMTEGRFRT